MKTSSDPRDTRDAVYWLGPCPNNISYFGPGCTSNQGHTATRTFFGNPWMRHPLECIRCHQQLWGMYTIHEQAEL